MPRDVLGVWLHGELVGTLRQTAVARLRLDFDADWLAGTPLGAPSLSLGLPASRTAHRDLDGTRRPVSAFVNGLLPEGQLLQQVTSRWGVSTIDTMGILRHVGAECAGAVQFLPEGQRPALGQLRLLSSDEVDELVSTLPTLAPPSGAEIQASLAGVQEKVLLTSTDDGWAWPEDGAPSSHIIKPEPLQGVIAGLVQWEHWGLEVAARAGLPAARSRLHEFGGRTALVVERYDRTTNGDRVHQEDFCQALGLDPQAKYESEPEASALGSRLSRVVALASPFALDPTALREDLLRQVTFNACLGNADAHSKNYSLLLPTDGTVGLAPLYDTAPIRLMNPRFRGSGMVIGGRTRLDDIDRQALLDEAETWGMAGRRAGRVIDETVEAVFEAAHATPVPDDQPVLERLDTRWGRWR